MSKARLLYVDDEDDIRTIVEFALEDGDFELKLCRSGAEALALVPTFAPELILLDVMMPGLDGPQTLERLRQLPQARTTPVAFVTAKVQPDEVAHLMRLGAIAVIPKPFDPMELPAQLGALLEGVRGG